MATTLTIAGSNKSSLVDWRSLRREQVLTKATDTLSFLVQVFEGQSYKPVAGSEVVLTVGSTKEFGGFIVEIEEEMQGQLEYVRCTCKDYSYSLDRQLVSKTYTVTSVEDIIADLISTFTSGFTVANVSAPEVIDSVSFNYLTVSRCIQKLTELVSGYDWYVDYDKDVHFLRVGTVSSVFDLSDTSNNYVIDSLLLREDTHQLRNEVIVRGGLLTSTVLRIEYLSGDATKDVFPLATKFANKPVVVLGGVTQTVGIENIDPEGSDCYWNYNEKSLNFASVPASGTANITVTEYPQYPLIVQKRNEESVGTHGLFQSVVVDVNIKDLSTAGLRADVELAQYSDPEKTADFVTYRSGLVTGDTINIQSDIRNMNQSYKIQRIASVLRTPDTDELTNTVSCVTAQDIGIGDILARLLVTNPSDQIRIEQDEFIERIRQLKDEFALVDVAPTGSFTTGPYDYGDADAVWGFTAWA